MAGCVPPPPGPRVREARHEAGAPHYRIEYDSLGRKHGTERWWHEDGTPKLEASWRAGVRHGAYRAWHPDGTPWYAGRDSLGVPVDTLRFWHPNGVLQSLSVFRDGAPARLETYDSLGRSPEQRLMEERLARERLEARRRADSVEAAEGPRRRALNEWAARMRATVETYWTIPESMTKTPRRTVARLRVASTGAVLGVTWTERSGSSAFDRHAARALAKVRKFPPFPPELGTEPLEIQYEFTTPGAVPPRRRLKLHDPDSAMGEE